MGPSMTVALAALCLFITPAMAGRSVNATVDVEGQTSTSIDTVTMKTDSGQSVNATVDVKGQTETSYMDTTGAMKTDNGWDIQKHVSYMDTSGAIMRDDGSDIQKHGSYMDTSGAIKTDDGTDIQKDGAIKTDDGTNIQKHGYADSTDVEPTKVVEPTDDDEKKEEPADVEPTPKDTKKSKTKADSSLPDELRAKCPNGRQRNKEGDCFKGCPEGSKFAEQDGEGNCECKEGTKCYDMEAVELAGELAKEFKNPEKGKELLQIVEKDQEGKSPGCKTASGEGKSAGSISERLFDHGCRSCLCKAGASGISLAAPLLASVFTLVIFGL